MSAGKTIDRIDTVPVDPDHGGTDIGTLIIYFTDGTALQIEGHSYDSVDLGMAELSADDLAARAVKVEQRLEDEREKQRKRDEWMALSCEERASHKKVERKTAGPMGYLLHDVYEGACVDMLVAANRQMYGVDAKPVTVRLPCERCGERACGNAPTKTYEPVAPAAGLEYNGLRAIIPTRRPNA